MECRETIRAETSDALAQITIAHYADNYHERFKELSKTTDTRGTQEVLKDRSIITYPTPVSDE